MTKETGSEEEQFLDISEQIKSLQKAQAHTREQIEEGRVEFKKDLDAIRKELSLLLRR